MNSHAKLLGEYKILWRKFICWLKWVICFAIGRNNQTWASLPLEFAELNDNYNTVHLYFETILQSKLIRLFYVHFSEKQIGMLKPYI